ncbi:MAG: hypothetical protein LQ338_007497, partial [Usnochroma carphineum]
MPSRRLPILIKKQNGQIGYRGGNFTARLERSSPRSNMPKARGIVGADPNELKLREAAARKKAFDRECFAAGSNGDEGDLEDVDEQEMEELIDEMMSFERPRKASVEKEGRKKSFAGRLLSIGG